MIYALKTTLSFYLSIDTTFLSTCNKSQDSQESCNKVFIRTIFLDGFPRWHGGKEPVCQKKKKKNLSAHVGHAGLIPGSGRFPGGGNGNTLQYSCLQNPTATGASWATIQGVAKSQT